MQVIRLTPGPAALGVPFCVASVGAVSGHSHLRAGILQVRSFDLLEPVDAPRETVPFKGVKTRIFSFQ